MRGSILRKISKLKILRKCIGRPFLLVNEFAWKRMPRSVTALRPIAAYGVFLQSLVRLKSERRQLYGSYFLRNRPALDLIRSLACRDNANSQLRIAVLGCSNGAEAYSIVWTIRSTCPDLKLEVHAIDISKEVLEFARRGLYSRRDGSLGQAAIFERLTDKEMDTIFDQEQNGFRIKPWIAQGIQWQIGDAGDPRITESLEPQDIVVANNFLCHMESTQAEKCLRNLARLVKRGGYLSIAGVDLDVRSRVAVGLGWIPIVERIEEIHDGDPSVRRDWPWTYWGLEPFDSTKPDWKTRYASVFRLGS